MTDKLKVLCGKEVTEDIYVGCDYVDRSVYADKYCGDGDNGSIRFQYNRETFVCLYDENNVEHPVVGYMEFFPINEGLHHEILVTSPYIHDDEILPETGSFLKKTPGMAKWSTRGNYVYLLSIAIHPDYQCKDNIILLTNAFIDYLNEMNAKYPIRDITATTVSKHGRKFANRLHMQPIRTLGAGEVVYQVKGQGLVDLLANNLNFDKLPEDALYEDCCRGQKECIYEHRSEPREYEKTYRDDMYIILPLAEHKDNPRTKAIFEPPEWVEDKPDNFDAEVEDELASAFISEMGELIGYEVDNRVVDELEMRFIDQWDFLHANDYYLHISKDLKDDYLKEHPDADIAEILSCGCNTFPDDERASVELDEDGNPAEQNEIIGLAKANVYLLAHRPTHMYMMILQFMDYEYCSSAMLDMMVYQYLKIVDPVRRDSFIPLYDYILYRYGLHRCGSEKAIVAMDKKPDTSEEFQDILLAESYTSKTVLYKPAGDKIRTMAETSYGQYDDYQSYISEKVIAYIYGNGFDDDELIRVHDIAEYLFVPIMVMLQNAAIFKMNTKVTNALASNGEISQDYILSLEREYGRTVRFWQRDCFKYPGAIHEADCINEAFDSKGILDEYRQQQDFIQNIMEMSSAREDNKSATLLNLFLLVLTFFQVSEFFETKLWSRFYEWAGVVDSSQSAADIQSQVQGLVDMSSVTTIAGLSILICALVIVNKYRKHNNIHGKEDK